MKSILLFLAIAASSHTASAANVFYTITPADRGKHTTVYLTNEQTKLCKGEWYVTKVEEGKDRWVGGCWKLNDAPGNVSVALWFLQTGQIMPEVTGWGMVEGAGKLFMDIQMKRVDGALERYRRNQEASQIRPHM